MTSVFFGKRTRTYHYDRTLGKSALGGAGFRSSVDLALGAEDRIYVLNRGWEHRDDLCRVTMLNINEDYIGQFSHFGERDGQLFWPTSLALDSDQNVYVSDEWLNRISIFDKDGEYLDKWGMSGSGDGELNKPSGVRFDKEDNLYVVDSGNNRVQKFTKDGKFLAKWGEPGSGEGQFNLPWGLAIDNSGGVYVADWRNDRVQKFTADGQYLAEFGSSGSGFGELNRPTGVAVDNDGDIYVADWRNDRVQAFAADGRHAHTFWGDAGISRWAQDLLDANPDMIMMMGLARDQVPWKPFWRPSAVAIDDAGRIIIVDTNRHRLQVYQKENYV